MICFFINQKILKSTIQYNYCDICSEERHKVTGSSLQMPLTIFYKILTLPSLICSSVIYRYRCPGCHASYYGKTTRNLVVRCREHLRINKAGQKIKSSPSAVGGHISKSGHDASLENFEIISRTDNSFDLLIHESLLILRDRPSLNSQLSSIPLALF